MDVKVTGRHLGGGGSAWQGGRLRSTRSLYKQALAGNVGAICFWLKNRRPSEWRDVQNIQADVGHYIIADRPMTEDEWIAARADRAKVVEDQSTPSTTNGTTLDE